jgi:uncharacterized repeat protein (TIGR04138 family)
MTMHHPGLAEVVRRDPRYAYEAYEFVFEALAHTQKLLNRMPPEGPAGVTAGQHHVSGRELLDGVKDLARREFGLMARTVFKLWGVNRTDDFGEIIFNLIDANLLSKTDSDSKADFRGVYDLDRALTEDYAISVELLDWPRRAE